MKLSQIFKENESSKEILNEEKVNLYFVGDKAAVFNDAITNGVFNGLDAPSKVAKVIVLLNNKGIDVFGRDLRNIVYDIYVKVEHDSNVATQIIGNGYNTPMSMTTYYKKNGLKAKINAFKKADIPTTTITTTSTDADIITNIHKALLVPPSDTTLEKLALTDDEAKMVYDLLNTGNFTKVLPWLSKFVTFDIDDGIKFRKALRYMINSSGDKGVTELFNAVASSNIKFIQTAIANYNSSL